jgi:hypothetical protein
MHGVRTDTGIAISVDGLDRKIEFPMSRGKGETTLPAGRYRICAVIGESHDGCGLVGIGDVYIIAGQSNAVSPAQGHPLKRSETGLVFVNDIYRFGTRRITDPSVEPSNASVAWIYAGDEIAKKVRYPLLFINVAAGGTSTRDWTEDRYGTMTQLLRTLERFPAKAVLWHQGESDCGLKMPKQETVANMRHIIERARQVRPIPWIVARNSTATAESPCGTKQAQEEIIASGLALAGPDTNAIRKSGQEEFVGDSLREHGELWAATLRDLFYAAKSK